MSNEILDFFDKKSERNEQENFAIEQEDLVATGADKTAIESELAEDEIVLENNVNENNSEECAQECLVAQDIANEKNITNMVNCKNACAKLNELINRDTIISKLYKKISAFEDDIVFNASKDIFKKLINIREDLRRCLRSLRVNEKKKDRKKDLKCDLMTFQQFLKINGIKKINDIWCLNEKSIDDGAEIPNIPKICNNDVFLNSCTNNDVERKIEELLNLDKLIFNQLLDLNNNLLDVIFSENKRNIFFSIIAIIEKTSKILEETDLLNEEEYIVILEDLENEIKEILLNNEIKIGVSKNDYFDENLQLILDTINTDDETKNGQILTRYSEWYEYKTKVIEREKVQVYLYNKN